MPTNEEILLDCCKCNCFSLADIMALLSADIDVNAKDTSGRTALHWSAENNNVILIQLLFKRGASIEAMQDTGHTPLHLAVKNNNPEAVDYLLMYHANIEAKDINGFTPLHWAAYMGHEICVAKLLANNADPYAVNNNNVNPMQISLLNNQLKITRFFYYYIQKENNNSMKKSTHKTGQSAATKEECSVEECNKITGIPTPQNNNLSLQYTESAYYNYFKPVLNTDDNCEQTSLAYFPS